MKDRSRLQLILVTDGSGDAEKILSIAGKAVRGGATAIQLRENKLSDLDYFDLGLRLRKLLPKNCLLLVNDRVDIALAVEADGVQLGFRSYAASQARTLLGSGKWIGASVHGLEEMDLRENEEADFFVFGPVFETPSKKGRVEAQGTKRLRQAANGSKRPVVAIGGINASNLSRTAETGCAGVAVIRALWESKDPEKEASKMKGQLLEIRPHSSSAFEIPSRLRRDSHF